MDNATPERPSAQTRRRIRPRLTPRVLIRAGLLVIACAALGLTVVGLGLPWIVLAYGQPMKVRITRRLVQEGTRLLLECEAPAQAGAASTRYLVQVAGPLYMRSREGQELPAVRLSLGRWEWVRLTDARRGAQWEASGLRESIELLGGMLLPIVVILAWPLARDGGLVRAGAEATAVVTGKRATQWRRYVAYEFREIEGAGTEPVSREVAVSRAAFERLHVGDALCVRYSRWEPRINVPERFAAFRVAGGKS